MATSEIDAVIDHWLGPWMAPDASTPERLALWFRVNEATDAEIRQRFGELIERASRAELGGWTSSARGTLALVILLDQFTRNAFRGTPRAFAQDGAARTATKHAIDRGFDRELPTVAAAFLYMPLVHSEEIADHVIADGLLRRTAESADAPTQKLAKAFFDAALKHTAIIERFGRYPHRNAILGRASTPEEIAFLLEPGSSF